MNRGVAAADMDSMEFNLDVVGGDDSDSIVKS